MMGRRGEWAGEGRRSRNKAVATLLPYLLVRGLPKLCQCSITRSIAGEIARKPPTRDKRTHHGTTHLQCSLQYTIWGVEKPY